MLGPVKTIISLIVREFATVLGLPRASEFSASGSKESTEGVRKQPETMFVTAGRQKATDKQVNSFRSAAESPRALVDLHPIRPGPLEVQGNPVIRGQSLRGERPSARGASE